MIDFLIYLDSNTSIIFYDNTKIGTITNNINNYSIRIQDLTNNLSCIVNPITYISSGDRDETEVYILTPDELESSLLAFNDGLYKITYTINEYSKVRYFIVYPNINSTFDTLLEDTNYTVDITPLGKIKYVGDTCDGDIQKIRMISALIEQLKSYSDVEITSTTESSYLTEINDIITKLNRLLEI